MAGRPKAKIDWKEVDKMLEADCTGTEIAASLGIHYNTLYERCKKDNSCDFSEYSALKKSSGDRILKMKMFELAKEGDRTMMVWLSKQRLGYTDKADHTSKGEKVGGPVNINLKIEKSGAEPYTSEDEVIRKHNLESS